MKRTRDGRGWRVLRMVLMACGGFALCISPTLRAAENPDTTPRLPVLHEARIDGMLVPTAESYVAGELILKLKPSSRAAGIHQPPGAVSLQRHLGDATLTPVFVVPGAPKATTIIEALQQAASRTQAWRASLTAGPQALAATTVATLPDLANIYKVNRDPSQCGELMATGQVKYCQPNYLMKAFEVPNDPYYHSANSWGQGYDDLWGLKKIHAAEAWDITKGQGVVVAVVDTGVDYTHQDLAANSWTNPNETPNNGLDDDGNGFIDDVRGWDFANGDGDPMDDQGHGTHVAGTIAAVGQNALGIVGVAPHAKILAVKGLGADGSGSAASLSQSLVYAARQGAKVINNSWGCSYCPDNPLGEDAVRTANALGTTVVFAAGNSNDDVQNRSPQNMTNPKPIVVAATDHNDARSDFSSFGGLVDVAAPGGESGPPCVQGSTPTPADLLRPSILSLRAAGTDLYADCGSAWAGKLVVGERYYRARGTSMAAPHAAGVAALIRSARPTLRSDDVRLVMRGSADDVGAIGIDRLTGAGRINALASVQSQTIAGELVEPKSDSRFGPVVIPLTGRLLPASAIERYWLEWSRDVVTPIWSQEGIALDGQGQVIPETVARLGTWDLGRLPESTNQLVVRLMIETRDGQRKEIDRHPIEMERWFQSGYPRPVRLPPSPETWPERCPGSQVVGGEGFQAPPQTVDLEGTGAVSFISSIGYIVYTCPGRLITVVNQYFAIEAGGPRLLREDREGIALSGAIQPVFVDIDRDGSKEVIGHNGRQLIAARFDGSAPAGNWQPQVIAPDIDTILNNPSLDYTVMSNPIIAANMDGDAGMEFVTLAVRPRLGAYEVIVFDDDGRVQRRISVPQVRSLDYNCLGCGNMAVGDLTGDGVPDIVLRVYDRETLADKIYAFNGTSGQLLNARFPILIGVVGPGSGLVIADIIGTPLPEIIVGNIHYEVGQERVFSASTIAVFDAAGQRLSRIVTDDYFVYGVTAADVNGDGRAELVTAGDGRDDAISPSPEGSVQVTDAMGIPLPGWPVTLSGFGRTQSEALVADLDGNGDQEIVIRSTDAFTILNHDGTPWRGGFERRRVPHYELQVADVDGDGDVELLAMDIQSIFAYDFPGVVGSRTSEWPLASRHDLNHTGRYSRAPRFTPTGPQTIQAGQELSFTVAASDPDGDPLLFSTGRQPVGASFDPITGRFIWRPTPQAIGDHTVRFVASDGASEDRLSIDIMVTSAQAGFESDTAPRPGGDGQLTITDWVQEGRYVAGYDTTELQQGTAFQRADCAPRDTKGDGQLTITDWVQAGRYVAGFDNAPVPAGGPTTPTTSSQQTARISSIATGAAVQSPRNVARTLRVPQLTVRPGQLVTIPVELTTQGGEQAVSFTVSVNPALLEYRHARLDPAAKGATLQLQTARITEGHLGAALIWPAGTPRSRDRQEVLRVTYRVRPAAIGRGTLLLTDTVLPLELADAFANPLPLQPQAGGVQVRSRKSNR